MKLKIIGMHGDLLRWIESYITNRCQAVALKGYTSNFLPIPSGVPQGSHLGPFLFTLYVNDMNNIFHNSSHLLYADDTKIYKVISSRSDCDALQEDLNSFASYCENNHLILNADKCHVISFSRQRNLIDSDYSISGEVIKRVHEIRDLGVTLDCKLRFDTHISNVIHKAFKQLGLILRLSRPFKKAATLKILYNSFVRSRLEYASVVWNPQYKIHIGRMEKVQNKFLKSLDYRTGNLFENYSNSAKRHRIAPLEKRRIYIDSIFLFKIINSLIDSPALLAKINFKCNRTSSRSKPTFYVDFCSTNYASNSFIRRAMRSHNVVFNDVDIFSLNLISFKRQIASRLFNF
jgi:hypothetical protein